MSSIYEQPKIKIVQVQADYPDIICTSGPNEVGMEWDSEAWGE